MPKENWYTPNPFQAKSGISSSKWTNHHRGFRLMKDEMNNGIYELIVLCKSTVIAKPELLTTALLFWNSSTNSFDFSMGPMSLTIPDIAQVGDAFVLQEATTEAKRQGIGAGGDVFKLLGDSEGEAKVEIAVPSVGQSSTSSLSTFPPLVVASTSQFDSSTREMLHFVEYDSNSVTHESQQPTTTAFGEPIVPEIPVVLEAISPRASPHPVIITKGLPPSTQDLAKGPEEDSGNFLPCLTSFIATPFEEVESLPSSPSPISTTAALPKLSKEFGQLKTKPKFSRYPSESSGFQNHRQVFQESLPLPFCCMLGQQLSLSCFLSLPYTNSFLIKDLTVTIWSFLLCSDITDKQNHEGVVGAQRGQYRATVELSPGCGGGSCWDVTATHPSIKTLLKGKSSFLPPMRSINSSNQAYASSVMPKFHACTRMRTMWHVISFPLNLAICLFYLIFASPMKLVSSLMRNFLKLHIFRKLKDVISRGYTAILHIKSGKRGHLEVEWKMIMLINIFRVESGDGTDVDCDFKDEESEEDYGEGVEMGDEFRESSHGLAAEEFFFFWDKGNFSFAAEDMIEEMKVKLIQRYLLALIVDV
ncbi:E3 ubiquitin-protein ligase RHA2B [Pyrus ussuriensis x Pyrus communis]|uniref:E3 ubiquitin-protein ligase RHA2B n=1 Tax=Pyrus ussuriensis x Pyrus communis TaxID=2448454 RepID=A0A5N5H2Q3_9ROSA|nr:E3 ubiquitin-protein ligase RHA2B [Pyrus ussuriensis x Pyrus communis]